MSLAQVIRNLIDGSRDGGDLTEEEAHRLFAAVLDGGVTDLELGGVIVALHARPLTLPQLLGFHSALVERQFRLTIPAPAPRPVILPSRFGTMEQPNLVPLLALLLQRFGVPVLVHGPLHGDGRMASSLIFRELGIMPCTYLSQAQARLAEEKLAFVPTAVLAPGLSWLLGLRSRLGLDRVAVTLAKLIDPFDGESLRVIPSVDPAEQSVLREFLTVKASRALLLEGTEGEPFADPRRRPNLEFFHDGEKEVLFDAEPASVRSLASQPPGIDAPSIALWIRRTMGGDAPLPLPLVNQIACCFYGCGYVGDMNQAKAIAAVETGSLIAA